jgi:hypothetical protein
MRLPETWFRLRGKRAVLLGQLLWWLLLRS